jgi:hypothetical protein
MTLRATQFVSLGLAIVIASMFQSRSEAQSGTPSSSSSPSEVSPSLQRPNPDLARELIGQPLRDLEGKSIGSVTDLVLLPAGDYAVLVKTMESSTPLFIPLPSLTKTPAGPSTSIGADTFKELPKQFSALPRGTMSATAGLFPQGLPVLVVAGSAVGGNNNSLIRNPSAIIRDPAAQIIEPFSKSRDAIRDIWRR